MIINLNRSDVALSFTTASGESLLMSTSSSSSNDGALAANQLMGSSISYLENDFPQGNLSARGDVSLGNDYEGVNSSMAHLDPVLLERFTHNRSIDGPWYHILIVLYSVLIIFGALGNTLVVIAVIRKPMMRTARNLFILNLAVSDLLLCLITMPLTLMEILAKYWPFGTCAFLCKIIATLQATSIFVSTISITAIAFDRYQVIVYPTRDSLQFIGALSILLGIWILALLLASPLFIYKRLIHADIPPLLQAIGIRGVSFCIEDWPLSHGRFYYSIFSLCVQYLVPILIVSGAYFGIYNKLKSRITVITVQTTQRKLERGRRMKRTNCLLISIAVIFGVSWLPLNFFNLYADMRRSAVTQSMLVAYAICHMIGMSSACSNPLLYGWLNDNFRGGQTRRRRKHADISKGDLKLLGSANGNGGGGGGGGVSGAGASGHRSAVTESVALTENPMSTEVTTLMSR